ncbi:MAG TPA: Asp-tRNA(Asn)/Glu-tRNA(Gln) amidotransferase subunit GatA [Candidatus Merdousia gallistercoris]|nr:Asp-tRNA(Asn)/Glu-tRNA(Gln) amidotransferase subunit GatA [Candidatus Merdousia gallistercoris]
MEIFYKTISELESMLDSKEISAVELAKAVIERKNSVDGKVGAFLSANEDELLAEASISDSLRAEGKKRGALEGIPIGLKDVLAVRGQKLTCASKILENYVSPYTASSLEKLKSRGGIFWGRLNMDEFAMGSSCENSAFQPTHNPWDLSRIPGGSSGGSAAAVAAGECVASLGSDTGGSIRQPASLCGVVGMKPTYGLVSRYGLAAFASSLDQIGPFARCVKDAAILLEAVAGHDPKDSTSVDCEIPDYASNISLEAFKGAKIGIPKEYFGAGIDPEVKAIVEKAIADCASQGAEIVEISLPHTDLAIPVYYIIATAEASSNLARYDGVRYTRRSPDTTDAIDIYYKSRAEGFGEEVKRRIILGSYVLSSGYYDAYYLRAQKVRTLIRRDFEAAFEKVDVIMTPTSPTTAFKIGEKTSDPLSMYLSDICTINVNLAGLPGISVPCGFSDAGLPVGLQMIGKAFDERNLLSFAASYEAAHEWASRRPTL